MIKIKERLHQYLWIQENVKELEDRLLEIDTQLTKVTAQLTADKVTTTKDPDKFTNLTSERIKVEKKINEEICKGLKEMQYIENMIEALPEREKYLMRLRYIQGEKWETICYKMDFEWTHVHNIHSKILKRLKSE